MHSFSQFNNYVNSKRLRILRLVFIIILICLGVRIYYLQVHPTVDVLNNYNNQQVEVTSDNKFKVYDRNFADLSDYISKYVVVIDKKAFSLNNYEDTLEELIAFNFIMKNEISDFNFTDIMKNSGKTYFEISKETYNKILKFVDIKGIYAYEKKEVQKKNSWNIANMIQQIPEEDEYVQGSLQYNINEIIKYNENEYKTFCVDDNAKYIASENIIPPKNKNIVLTIDKNYQDGIKNILNQDKYKKFENIGVILMNSNSGKIESMVQKDESQANINICAGGSGYEPGSIFKIITLASALEDGKVTMNSEFTCAGNICKDGSHGRLTVNDAFVKSCNDIFAQIGEKVTYDRIMFYSKECGLFSRTLEMQGETLGNIPDKMDGMNNISIGQCVTASPLQMLGAINSVVNDGIYVKPYIIDKVIDKDSNIIDEYKAEKKNVFTKTTALQIKNAMKDVTIYGTGKKAYLDGADVGGKTGSATSGTGDTTHCWFAGFFTIDGKQYTMIVFVPNVQTENAGGGDISAPIFKEILSFLYFQ